MTSSSNAWCNASAPCRIDWRPSRWLLAALLLLTLLAPLAVLASELPRASAWLLAAAAAVQGLHLARREWRRPPRTLRFTTDGRLLVDDVAASHVQVQWRGPLAFLSWRDAGGCHGSLAWWPDTLPPHRRRELRLAVDRLPAARAGPSVAP
jgi:toxin CptA